MQRLSFWRQLNVLRRLLEIEEEITKMDADTVALKGIVSKIAGDVSKFTADVKAKLATITPADPDQAQTIKDAVTALTALDDSVTTADAALNPPAAGGDTGTPVA